MFCMNCGQQLPDGAKYCLQCGTPQGAVSPTGTTQAETINLDGMHTFVPALCPNCSAHMKVDSSAKVAHCDSCGTECLVQDAIKALTVRGNVQVGSATINVSGTNTDSLLQRVEIMLGDGDFGGAMSKCDTVLDSDPTNGKVYFYMLMSSLKCKTKSELANQLVPFDKNKYYIMAHRYGDDSMRLELLDYINSIESRNITTQKTLKVGDIFYFGTYNNQPIIWKALLIQDHKALVISSENLCKMLYHQFSVERITWSDCTLRKWLNNDFINSSFTQVERARIISSELNNERNPKSIYSAGNPTIDKVFLLSINEAEQFSGLLKEDRCSDWWLRSPGKKPNYAAYYAYGKVNLDGDIVSGHCESLPIYVRPSLWIVL